MQITYSGGPEVAVVDWTDRGADSTFDLHGQTVMEAAANVERFLMAQGRARPGGVVRLITGRGRGGGGAPVRTRVRTLLRHFREEGRLVRDFVMEEGEGSFLVRLR
ncbi:MAG: Smr/MutS family protein [Gemmatimonadales bacterium]|nr:Smr/MutS family protein [Gemmatimonadales bacterium]